MLGKSMFFRGLTAMICCLAVSTVWAEVQYPEGTQDFEGMQVGDGVATLVDWVVVNNSVPSSNFQVLAANDVLGNVQVHNLSTRWLRVSDVDGADVQNRFYTPTIVSPSDQDYTWTYFVNLEQTPPGGAGTKPKIVMQHVNAGPFANAWGIEFRDTGAYLIVTGIGGPAASTLLYPLSGSTGIGEWVRIRFSVDFSQNTVSASANSGLTVSLPISLAPTADKKLFRWCYRGEGPNNVNRMLVDDITVQVGAAQTIPTVSEWGLIAMALLLVAAGRFYFGRRLVSA